MKVYPDFLNGGRRDLSQEGTTQGDTLAMPWYSVVTSAMIQCLRFESMVGGWFSRSRKIGSWHKHLEEKERNLVTW